MERPQPSFSSLAMINVKMEVFLSQYKDAVLPV